MNRTQLEVPSGGRDLLIMPTIHYLCEFPSLNGGERSMLSVWDGIMEKGYRPVLIGPGEGPLAEAARRRGVRVIAFGTTDSAGNRLSQEERRAWLGRILEEDRVELLHANSLAMGRLAGPVAREAGVRSIAHLRDIMKLSRKAIEDLNANARIIAVSNAVKAFHAAAGLDAAKTHVIYNGVDLETFRPRPASGFLHEELGIPPGAPLVAAMGQIGLRKGFDVLAQAAIELSRRFPDVHYLILGERSSDKEESREFERNLRETFGRLGERAHFLGVRTDVSRVMNELTLLVHPARQEPLGRVLLEAAASGVAVVATDVGGTVEIFPPRSGTAWLVPKDDVGALVEAMGELLSDETLREKMGEAARCRAKEAFAIGPAVERMVGEYGGMKSV